MSLSEAKIRHLNALSNKDGVIAAAAMDQRGSLQKAIAAARGISNDQVTADMMSEFKIAVTKVLTPHASAILLDPEFGLPAAKARSSNAGLLLAYEESGYDNTKPGRLPDLLPHVSARRIAGWGADAVKILLYYTPFDDPQVNDIKHAFIERIGAECQADQIPFFCEFVGYDPKGGDEKRLRVCQAQTASRDREHAGITKPQYLIDVLKVEVPVNANYVEGAACIKAKSLSRPRRPWGISAAPPKWPLAVHLSQRGRQQCPVRRIAEHGGRSRNRLLRRLADAPPGKTASRSTPNRASKRWKIG